jgi:hypothetical protein
MTCPVCRKPSAGVPLQPNVVRAPAPPPRVAAQSPPPPAPRRVYPRYSASPSDLRGRITGLGNGNRR